MQAPTYLLGGEDAGFIVRDDGSVPVWTSEFAVVRFIEKHEHLGWIPLDFTEVGDDLTLVTVLQRLRRQGAQSVVVDLLDVDQKVQPVCKLDDLMDSLLLTSRSPTSRMQ